MDVQCVGVTFLDMFTRSHFFFFFGLFILAFQQQEMALLFQNPVISLYYKFRF